MTLAWILAIACIVAVLIACRVLVKHEKQDRAEKELFSDEQEIDPPIEHAEGPEDE